MTNDLKLLPNDHIKRNSPLVEIGAQYKGVHDSNWRSVLPSFGIARNTFNDLGETWLASQEWRYTI